MPGYSLRKGDVQRGGKNEGLKIDDELFYTFLCHFQITAPANLTVLMSALRDETVESSGDTRTHKFHQPVPIPVYLTAIAVGKIVSRKVGPRSHVWAEQEFIEQSAYEFAETETMLSTAEAICGPYVWGEFNRLKK